VAHITSAEITAVRAFVILDAAVFQRGFQGIEQGVEGGSVAEGHVVNLVLRFGLGGGGQQVDLDDVFDEAEVAAGFAVAVDEHILALDHRGSPFGDHGGVGAVRILALAEHVKISQANGVEAVGTGEHVCVEFVDVLGDGIGRQGLANLVFYLGQPRVVAVGGA